jgi:hypothetical protein
MDIEVTIAFDQQTKTRRLGNQCSYFYTYAYGVYICFYNYTCQLNN